MLVCGFGEIITWKEERKEEEERIAILSCTLIKKTER